jgi:hypothetical protein
MGLSDLASIAIIVQGVAFIVSIYFVWYQLRETTRQVRTANTQRLVELSAPFNMQLAQSRDLTILWKQGGQALDTLDDIDRERYFNLLTCWLILHENIYHQWRRKLVDEDTFNSWTRDLEYFVKRQNVAAQWELFGDYFEASFANHVRTVIRRQTAEKDQGQDSKKAPA